jgi:hypothetical protein
VVGRKRPELWPHDWIFHHNKAPTYNALSIEKFLDQKSITEMEHQCYFSRCFSGCFQKYFPPRRDEDFRILKILKAKCDDGTESYSTTGAPKIFPAAAAS